MPSKLGGVLALLGSILVLVTLPLSHSQSMKGLCFYGPVKAFFWLHVTVFLMLTAAGAWPVEAPYLILSRILSCVYFSFFALVGVYRWV